MNLKPESKFTIKSLEDLIYIMKNKGFDENTEIEFIVNPIYQTVKYSEIDFTVKNKVTIFLNKSE